MVEVFSIEPTTFEDDSYWLTYKQDNKYYGYEIRYPYNIINPIPENKIFVEDLKMSSLIIDVLYSNNEMLYIDETEDKVYYEECKRLIEEDLKLHPELKDYIEYEAYDELTDSIVISGTIITECLFTKL